MKIIDVEKLVPFLGIAMGDQCEIALQDCSKSCIVAIENGYISGRKVGSPLTDLAKKIIENGDWKTCDYITGYDGHTLDKKLIRSSTFFIKEEEELLGMLCINIDTSKYSRLSEIILDLGGLVASGKPVLKGSEQDSRQETFIDTIEFALSSILKNLYGDTIPDTFSQNDRLSIIEYMEEKEIFMVKGAISRVAEKLGCSEASMYRYLSKVRRETSKK